MHHKQINSFKYLLRTYSLHTLTQSTVKCVINVPSLLHLAVNCNDHVSHQHLLCIYDSTAQARSAQILCQMVRNAEQLITGIGKVDIHGIENLEYIHDELNQIFIFWCCLCNISQKRSPLFVVIKECIIERKGDDIFINVNTFFLHMQPFWPLRCLTESFTIMGYVYMCMLFF